MQKGGGSNNTTMTQFAIKLKIFAWVALFVVVMVLTITMYDKEHRFLMGILPIATVFPCVYNINKNLKKLEQAKEAEKIYISRTSKKK